MKSKLKTVGLGAAALIFSSSAVAMPPGCNDLPNHADLTDALKDSVFPTSGEANGGLDFNMWATLVNRDGKVCQITFSGVDRGAQWPGSRVISAQKANTANAFSLPGFALSTANLFSAVQPGGSLYGLQHSNPVDAAVAYAGPNHAGANANRYGLPNDPMKGHIIGGVNVFGGGLALYTSGGELIGGLGVSGDTSCADHNVAWRVRQVLGLANVPAGVNTDNNDDGINYYDPAADDPSGFTHPTCSEEDPNAPPTEHEIANNIGAGSGP